jgi:hypothetical protein
MQKLSISRFYIFDPEDSTFRSWNGSWVSFVGAQDFLSISAAEKALSSIQTTKILFIFKLVRDGV